ncbi:MAG: ECF-type sigma factor [Thermoanaerobaculia bacterium]
MPPEGPESSPGREPTDITRWLAAARGGDRDAYDRVFTRVYDELRRLAARQIRSFGARATMNTTALVHEAYLKLSGDARWSGNDRVHFFALAARAMRQILVDHARRRTRKKRGGKQQDLDLDAIEIPVHEQAEEILALDEALERLGAVDADLVRLVEWRFFAGWTLEEIAKETGVSERTIKRDWRVARAFLYRELGGGESPPPG